MWLSDACLCSYLFNKLIFSLGCLESNTVDWLFAWSYHHLGDWFGFHRKFNCSSVKHHSENFSFQVSVRSYAGKTHIYLYLNFIGLFNYVYHKIGDGKTFGFESQEITCGWWCIAWILLTRKILYLSVRPYDVNCGIIMLILLRWMLRNVAVVIFRLTYQFSELCDDGSSATFCRL